MRKAGHQPLIRLLCLLLLYQPGLAADGNVVDAIADLPRHIAFACQHAAVEVAVFYILQCLLDDAKLPPDTQQCAGKVADDQQCQHQRQKQRMVDGHRYASLLKRYPTPRTVWM
ncbi:hypothetical protein SDC9_209805 [bioreactor metagenome]|uniref:Uncharacterized protein n=1 Tax=bioreactor metagenome TaxID=1076179 RepID=A0A645JH91_9ZZZZ